MTTPDNLPPQNEELNPNLVILSTPELPPRPESIVYADGAIFVSRDPTASAEEQNRLNQDALLRIEDRGVYGVFGGVEGSDGVACVASKAVEDYLSVSPAPKSTREAYARMSDAMFKAREAVYAEGPEKKTTGTIIQAYEDEASGSSFVTIGHAGDARAYILRAKDGKLEQLTEDQGDTVGGTIGGVDYGAEYVLSNAIGGQDPRGRNRPGRRDQIIAVPVKKGDRIMLCTDGVTGSNALSDEELKTTITAGSPRDAAISLAHASIGKDGAERPADDKAAFVLEIGSPKETKVSLSVPEASISPTGLVSGYLGRLGTGASTTMHMNGQHFGSMKGQLFDPERRVVKGFPDSREGKAGYGANSLQSVLDRVRRPGETSQVIDALIEAAETEQSEIGYAANGTSIRDELVAEVTKLVASHNKLLQRDPNQMNGNIYDLDALLRSFKPLNKDLVTPTEWEKATAFYRAKGPGELAAFQIKMTNNFMRGVEALRSDPRLTGDSHVQKILSLVSGLRGALGAHAPWDGVSAKGGPGANLATNRMLAIMNGEEAALLQGNKHKPTITTAQMGLIERLAKEYKNVTDPGGKKSANPDYINAKGVNPARIMLAYELLDIDGISQVLGTKIDPDTMRFGPYKGQHTIRWARKRQEFRENVYRTEVLPRMNLLGMNRDTLIAVLKDDVGTQTLMDLISNAASGPLRNKLLVQRPPTP